VRQRAGPAHASAAGGLGGLQVIKGYQKFSATPKYMVYN
jgi:hypothetical protein